jgi:hypothetical protein
MKIKIQKQNGLIYEEDKVISLIERRPTDGFFVRRSYKNNISLERKVQIERISETETLILREDLFAFEDVYYCLSKNEDNSYGNISSDPNNKMRIRSHWVWNARLDPENIVKIFLQNCDGKNCGIRIKDGDWIPEWANGLYVELPECYKQVERPDSLKYNFVFYRDVVRREK